MGLVVRSGCYRAPVMPSALIVSVASRPSRRLAGPRMLGLHGRRKTAGLLARQIGVRGGPGVLQGTLDAGVRGLGAGVPALCGAS